MSLKWRLDRTQLHRLKQEAAHAGKHGREVCGLLVRSSGSLCLVPVRNSATEFGSFETTYRNRLIALRALKIPSSSIVGGYHSHPLSPPIPGSSDIDGTWDGALMLIVSAWDRSVRLWRITRGRAVPITMLRR